MISHSRPLQLCLVLIFAVAMVLAPQTALAHAVLVKSTPAAHSTVQGPDLLVTVTFNSRVDGSRSVIMVTPTNGQPKPLQLDKQTSPDTLTGRVSELGPGMYSIQWQVLSADGHITRGQIPFQVK